VHDIDDGLPLIGHSACEAHARARSEAPQALWLCTGAQSPGPRALFWECDEDIGDVELPLELGVALDELQVAPLGFGQPRLAAGLLRREARGTLRAQLLPP
jgi:hypothetical protein